MSTHTIVIDLFEGAEELDVVGPWEVLAHWAGTYPQDGREVVLATDDGRPRRCAKGLVLGPTRSWADVDPAGVAVVVEPGGRGSRTRLTDEGHLARLRELASAGALMTSVCTGALVLAAAGLLAGRPATTYHAAFDELLAVDPSITPRRGDRWVDDGDVVTAAGVSAGIDMSLHLVGRLADPGRARQVRRGIEYDPQPPTWSPS